VEFQGGPNVQGISSRSKVVANCNGLRFYLYHFDERQRAKLNWWRVNKNSNLIFAAAEAFA
jgi:uncharacterized membrane protein YsdA (DUF1294 family)